MPPPVLVARTGLVVLGGGRLRAAHGKTVAGGGSDGTVEVPSGNPVSCWWHRKTKDNGEKNSGVEQVILCEDTAAAKAGTVY